MDNLAIGDKVTVVSKNKRQVTRKPGIIHGIHEKFLTINYGAYRDSIDLFDIKNGTIQIIKEVQEDMNKLEIDVNKMLDICREHGTGKEGIEKVASALGLSLKQAENQIFLKKIRRILEEEKRKNAEPEVKIPAGDGIIDDAAAIQTIQEPETESKCGIELNQNIANNIIQNKPKPIKFYIASKLENADQVKKVAAVLKRFGWQHTYDWTVHGSVQTEGEERIKEVAAKELNGVRDADVVIVLLPGGRGTHAELGGANILGKRVIIWAQTEEFFLQDGNTCAFYWNENVTRVTGDLFNLLAVCDDYETKLAG